MPRHGQHKQRYAQKQKQYKKKTSKNKQRKHILITVPSSSVYDALGLNPRQAPYRSVVGIMAAHSGCLGQKLYLPSITFSNTEPRDMTKVINTLKRTLGFSMLAYHNCIEMISPHNLPFPIAMEEGWAECWENLLRRYRYLYGKPAATPMYMPVLELMFAIYKVNEHWRVKKRKTISNDQMAAEEDSAHLKGQSLLVNMGSTSHIEVAPKSKVKFKKVKRYFQQQYSISHIPYEIGAKPDGMYVINGHQVISDAKGTKVISDEYVLQALLFAYVFETRFAFIVCQYDEQPTRIFAVDSDVATIKRYRDDHLLRAFDDLMTGLCSLNACAFASNFYDPRNQAIRERTYISMIQSCLPVNLTYLDANVTISNESKSSFFEDNFTHRSPKFQDFRKNLVTVPSYSFLPPLDVQIVPNQWNELIGIDCFKGCDTHVIDFPEENGLQHCQDICRKNNYGGFGLYGTSVYFRKEPPHLLVQSLCRLDKAVFHLAPISAEKYQHLPDEIKEKKACITDGVTDDRCPSSNADEQSQRSNQGNNKNAMYQDQMIARSSCVVEISNIADSETDSKQPKTEEKNPGFSSTATKYTTSPESTQNMTVEHFDDKTSTQKKNNEKQKSEMSFHGPYDDCCFLNLAEEIREYNSLVDAKIAASKNPSVYAITLTRGKYTLRAQGKMHVSTRHERSWIKAGAAKTAVSKERQLRIWEPGMFYDPCFNTRGYLARFLAFFIAGSVEFD